MNTHARIEYPYPVTGRRTRSVNSTVRLFPYRFENRLSPSIDQISGTRLSEADNSHAPGADESKDVLIVEDEPYLCDLVADVLEADGHHARKAANGLDALARVAEAKPQLILLDLMMPIMDGWEFMSALQSNPNWTDIPVVIITAFYDVARAQHETGAKAIITKPFDIDQLADIVKMFAS